MWKFFMFNLPYNNRLKKSNDAGYTNPRTILHQEWFSSCSPTLSISKSSKWIIHGYSSKYINWWNLQWIKIMLIATAYSDEEKNYDFIDLIRCETCVVHINDFILRHTRVKILYLIWINCSIEHFKINLHL